MVNELNNIIVEEYKALQGLLASLDEQYKHLTKQQVFELDSVRDKIEKCSREVAHFEVQRRKITNGKDMSKVVEELKDEKLENNYRNIKKLLHAIQFQKDTNEILIKQKLGFTTQMLNFLNPNKTPKTYNAYGKRK